MTMRTRTIEPYKSGGNSNDHEKKGQTVKIRANMSGERNSGTEGALHTALAYRQQTLPSDNHIWTHTTRVEPAGERYTPAGEFGSRSAQGTGKGVYSYGGAPNKKGSNPLGSPPNKKGDNPLGRALNRVGTNAIGKAPNRKGTNAIGNAPNRSGQKSGYTKFLPKGGGKNV